ncbi:MAG: 3-dehydroquinate synthase [Candidatus Fervidibacter sp.]|uniref:3-dehydroquinate synthase n=1 Tax=Candidatus Fervidibacter sp. TaxID=3100871 RepID=UPI00404946DA
MVTKPIALWGFMGSGKTSVGKALAQKLSCEFVDTDEVIAKNFNKPITRIFAEDGEAVFRQAESKLLTELLQRQNIVIATGGGMPTVPENLSALRAKALNFYLRTPVDVIYERLAMVSDRPLLEGFSDRYRRIATLLAQRERFYTQAQVIVNCGRQSPEQISERIYAWVRALENEDDVVTVDLQERSYQVVVGSDLSLRIDRIAEACDLQSPFAVVHDESVSNFAEKVCERLSEKGKTKRRAVPSGEASKSIEQTIMLWHWLAEMAMPRNGTIFAVGGGVVGDLVGFVAATYMRGIAYAQVPTTLLAMVDSSIGGKTAIDIPHAKNLVGAFHQPSLVVSDLSCLRTIPDRAFVAGLAEVVKYGVIADPLLLKYLHDNADPILRRHPVALRSIIVRSASIKASIVALDEREQTGLRTILNYGHTFGHALEAATNFQLLHGEAVAIGMTAEAYLAWRLGWCDREVLDAQIDVLRALELPTKLKEVAEPILAPEIAPLMEIMQRDKKRKGSVVRFALPKRLGEVGVTDFPVPDDLLADAWVFVLR